MSLGQLLQGWPMECEPSKAAPAQPRPRDVPGDFGGISWDGGIPRLVMLSRSHLWSLQAPGGKG